MYKAVKKLDLTIIPKDFLVKNELFFRSLFAQRFKGKDHLCNICENSLKKFIILDDGDQLCPFCGSRPRTRRLFQILNSEEILKGNVLHFSPSRSLYRLLSKDQNIQYTSTDYEDEFIADHQYRLSRCTFRSNYLLSYSRTYRKRPESNARAAQSIKTGWNMFGTNTVHG